MLSSVFPPLVDRRAAVPALLVSEEQDPHHHLEGVAEDESDNEAAEADEDDCEPGAEATRPRIRRHAFTLKAKVMVIAKILQIQTSLSERFARPVTMEHILRVAHHSTGISASTLDKWMRKRAVILARYEDKKAFRRSSRKFGCGRKPRFPNSEAATAALIRERRQAGKITTRNFVLKKLKELARDENFAAFANFKFSVDYFRGFLRRERLALRLPSCIKAMSLDDGVLAARGWLQWLRHLIRDDWPNGAKYALRLDEKCGRYLFVSRLNKDEVVTFY